MASSLRAVTGWDDKDRGDRSFSVLSVLDFENGVAIAA